MTHRQQTLMAALICFALAALVLIIFLDVNVLSDESAIIVTPPVWLENKFMEWDGVEYNYQVEGRWFTDGEYPGHHVWEQRMFPVTRDVFWSVLIEDSQGRMTQRLCRLGRIEGDKLFSVATCVNGTQYWLPLAIQ